MEDSGNNLTSRKTLPLSEGGKIPSFQVAQEVKMGIGRFNFADVVDIGITPEGETVDYSKLIHHNKGRAGLKDEGRKHAQLLYGQYLDQGGLDSQEMLDPDALQEQILSLRERFKRPRTQQELKQEDPDMRAKREFASLLANSLQARRQRFLERDIAAYVEASNSPLAAMTNRLGEYIYEHSDFSHQNQKILARNAASKAVQSLAKVVVEESRAVAGKDSDTTDRIADVISEAISQAGMEEINREKQSSDSAESLATRLKISTLLVLNKNMLNPRIMDLRNRLKNATDEKIKRQIARELKIEVDKRFRNSVAREIKETALVEAVAREILSEKTSPVTVVKSEEESPSLVKDAKNEVSQEEPIQPEEVSTYTSPKETVSSNLPDDVARALTESSVPVPTKLTDEDVVQQVNHVDVSANEEKEEALQQTAFLEDLKHSLINEIDTREIGDYKPDTLSDSTQEILTPIAQENLNYFLRFIQDPNVQEEYKIKTLGEIVRLNGIETSDQALRELLFNAQNNSKTSIKLSFLNQNNLSGRVGEIVESIKQKYSKDVPIADLLSEESIQGLQGLGEAKKNIIEAQNAEEVIEARIKAYESTGSNRMEALLEVLESDWIKETHPEMQKLYLKYKSELGKIVESKLGVAGKLDKFLIEKRIGKKIESILDLPEIASQPKILKRLQKRIDSIINPDPLSKGQKFVRAGLNMVRLVNTVTNVTSSLSSEGAARQLFEMREDDQIEAGRRIGENIHDLIDGLNGKVLPGVSFDVLSTAQVTEIISPSENLQETIEPDEGNVATTQQIQAEQEKQDHFVQEKDTASNNHGEDTHQSVEVQKTETEVKSLSEYVLNPVIREAVESRLERYNQMSEEEKSEFIDLIGGEENLHSKRINIAFIGLDASWDRLERAGVDLSNKEVAQSQYEGRADQIHVLSIDARDNSVSWITLPRDMRIPEEYGKAINTMTWFGTRPDGNVDLSNPKPPDHSREILEHATGLPIDMVTEATFDGFTGMIGVLFPDGLEWTPDKDYAIGRVEYHGGHTYNLSPDDILSFVRYRYGSGGSYGRESRAVDVMQVAINDLIKDFKSDPKQIFSRLDNSISELERMEEEREIRVSWGFDIEHNGQEIPVTLTQFAKLYLESMNQTLSDPGQQGALLRLLAEEYKNLVPSFNRISPSFDTEEDDLRLMSVNDKPILETGQSEYADPEKAISYWSRFRSYIRNKLDI